MVNKVWTLMFFTFMARLCQYFDFADPYDKNLETLECTKISNPHVSSINGLSCTLFSLAISGILQSVPEIVKTALYMENLLIYSCGTFVPGVERRIQLSINRVSTWASTKRVSTWASTKRFIFSVVKTNCIHFHHKRRFQPPLILTLNNTQ